MFVGTNYAFDAGDDYENESIITQTRKYEEGSPAWYVVGSGKEVQETKVAQFDQILDYPEREAFGTADVPGDVYTSLYNDQISFPHLPVEYDTYGDEMGYGPAGYTAVSPKGAGRVV